MMNINFDVYFQKNIGTLYKDNEIDTQGREAKVNLDLNEVSTLIVTFNIGATSITDTVTIKDVNEGLIQIPFKSNVIKQGLNSFEIEALMKNGDVKVSQTYCYHIEKSLENENSVVAETNYPILIQLLSDVQSVKDAELIRISNEQARQVLKDELLVLKTNLEGLQSGLNSLDDTVTGNENTRVENEQARQTLKASLETLQTNLNSLENNITANEDARILEMTNKVKEINDKIIDVEARTVAKEADIENKIVNVEARTVAKESLIDNKIIEVEARTVAKETLVNNKIVEANATIDNTNIAKNNTIVATTNATNKITETEATRQSIITTINNLVAQFNALAPANSTNAEVQLARTDLTGKTFASLQERLLSDSKGANITYLSVEGTYNTIVDSVEGKVQSIEVLGNTYQDPNNLANIKSVANVFSDNTYKMSILSYNKNLISLDKIVLGAINDDGTDRVSTATRIEFVKVKSTTTYTLSRNGVARNSNIFYYDINKKFISKDSTVKATFTTPSNCTYIRFFFGTSLEDSIQLEVGTAATIYESPLYNKVEIVSLVQLEKVDTIADRLYYYLTKSVWCIDKNIGTITYNGTETTWVLNDSTTYTNTIWFTIPRNLSKASSKVICNKFTNVTVKGDYEGIFVDATNIYLGLSKTKCTDLATFKTWLISNNVLVKYQANTTTVIELPLSTQIALSSFMGTTHYYSDDTEIEPTLKGKFAKSLSAGYESLHNKTDILGDRIAGLEGLKDSQEFAYKTSTGYLNCLNTKDASVDNLKLSGRTLNNIVPNYTISWINNGTWQSKFLVAKTYSIVSNSVKVIQDIKPSTDYTIICNVTKNTSSSDIFIHNTSQLDVCYFNTPLKVVAGVTGYFVFKTKSISDFSTLITNDRVVLRSQNNGASTGEVEIKNIMVLEGDLTNCSPSYFEGMKSTGQDVNEIEVSSQNSGNLFNGTMENGGIGNTDGTIKAWANYIRTKDFIEVCSGIDYTFELLTSITISNLYISQYTKDKVFIKESVSAGLNKTTFTLDKATKYIKVYANKSTTFDTTNFISLSVCIGTKINSFASKQHKKQILYYNSTGQLVAIPELRGIWNGTTLVIGDTVEKHSDSKWYWHKRMLETTLNGSEVGWALEDGTLINTNLYSLMLTNLSGGITDLLCDKLPTKAIYSLDEEGISKHSTLNKLYIRLSKTKAPDLTTFKTYLSTNNHVLVHKSVTEEVYEVIDLHLDSYSNETMILLNGVIPAYIEWTVSSYLPNFVKDINEEVKTLQDRNVLMMASLLNIQTRLTAHGI